MNIIVPRSIYPSDLMCSFGESDKELRERLKAFGVRVKGTAHKYPPQASGITAHYENGFTLIRMRVVPKCPEDYSVLAHEIFHAAGFILEYAGHPLQGAENEAYAYLVEYLTREIYKVLMKPEE